MTIEEPLDIRTDLRPAEYAIVTVRGEIDLETAPELERRLLEVAERRMPIVVDLSECRYMDSSGFRALHRTAALCRVVLVIPAGAFLERVARLAGLAELVAIRNDVAGATEHLRTEPR